MRPSRRGPSIRVVAACSFAVLAVSWWSGSASAGSRAPTNNLDPTFGNGGVVVTDLPPADEEIAIGLAILAKAGSRKEGAGLPWEMYCQVLLCANEFLYID